MEKDILTKEEMESHQDRHFKTIDKLVSKLEKEKSFGNYLRISKELETTLKKQNAFYLDMLSQYVDGLTD